MNTLNMHNHEWDLRAKKNCIFRQIATYIKLSYNTIIQDILPVLPKTKFPLKD